jgi:hypothetical protein
LPASCSLKILAAVKVFECEATWKRCRGVSASPVSRSATPNARSRTRAPLPATAQDAARKLRRPHLIVEPGFGVADGGVEPIEHR